MTEQRTPKARRGYPSQAKLRSVTPVLVEVARSLGLDVAGIEVSPDGAIRVIEARALGPVAAGNDFDRFKDEL